MKALLPKLPNLKRPVVVVCVRVDFSAGTCEQLNMNAHTIYGKAHPPRAGVHLLKMNVTVGNHYLVKRAVVIEPNLAVLPFYDTLFCGLRKDFRHARN